MNSNSDLFQAILAMDAYNRIGGDVTARNLMVDTTSLGNVDLSDAKGDNASAWMFSDPSSTLGVKWNGTLAGADEADRKICF